MTGQRQWSVRIEAPDDFINANQRQHRLAGGRQRIAAWRWAGAAYARHNKLPHLTGRARIHAQLHFADNRRRDDHNYFGTVKAIIDGIVGDYGLLPDDTATHLVGVEISRGAPAPAKKFGPKGAVTITVTEVAQ